MGAKGGILPRGGMLNYRLAPVEAARLEKSLLIEVRRLVNEINRRIGDDYLYFTECLGTWVLFGKREGHCDYRVADGFVNVHELAALITVLQKEIKGELE